MKTRFTMPADTSIADERDFRAPAAEVWRAYTEPGIVRSRLLGPDPDTEFPVCEMDMRTGGSFRWVWVDAAGELEIAGEVLEADERHRVTATMGVPTTYRALVQHPDFLARDLSSLTTAIVGGGMLDPRTTELLRRQGVPVRQGYGLTEAAPNVSLARDESDDGTAGRLYPHVDVALLVDGRVQSAPGRGELLVRGPALFQGYFRDPEATAEARFGSWLRTGDLVERDAAGRIRVVDRMKDIVRSGAESIAPIEVELALLEHPAVAEAAVAGVPSERWGEEVVAWLVLEGVATEEDLRGHLDGRIAEFKHPKRFVIVDGIPRTSTGKPLRRALAASLEQQGAVS